MDLRGSYVAIVTPMESDGGLALEALAGLVSMHLEQGTAGIVVAGTTGEAANLTDEEYSAVIEAVKARVAGQCPVLAGVGAPGTAKAVSLARRAARAGADALLCVTPYYLRTTQAGLEAHYQALADAVDRPIVLYNVPGRTGVDLQPETVGRLAELAPVCAIKEAVAGGQRVRDILAACSGRITVLSGDDGSCLEAMLAGASGVISVTANVAPQAMAEMCRLVREGERSAAGALDSRLAPLHRTLMDEPNPIPVKWALSERGRIPSGIRLPLVPATPGLARDLGGVMAAQADLITV